MTCPRCNNPVDPTAANEWGYCYACRKPFTTDKAEFEKLLCREERDRMNREARIERGNYERKRA
jgi:predicted amidophosphoribosyltransferase